MISIIGSSNIVNPPQQTETISSKRIFNLRYWKYCKSKKQVKRFENFITQKRYGGIPAVLLNQSSELGIDVVILLVKIVEGIPDFRAAAELSTTISRLVPGVSCDVPLLLQEAEKIEKEIGKIKTQDTESELNAYG